jgi:putative oxidoreductase
MFRKLVHTSNDGMLAMLRLALGVIYFAHGAQLMLGWFGGLGFDRSMTYFTQTMGIPTFFAALAIISQFFGGIGLIIGFLTRIAAFGIAIDMLVAIFLVHLPNGFFMNWYGTKHGEGFEFHILAVAIALFAMVHGAGALSVDRAITVAEAHHPLSRMPHPQPMRG